jgi:hypothetical protein
VLNTIQHIIMPNLGMSSSLISHEQKEHDQKAEYNQAHKGLKSYLF